MKAKISIILLALVALALFAVAPVAATGVANVSLGGVVFVGEEGLTFNSDIDGIVNITATTVLNYYDAGDTVNVSEPAATYTCQGAGNEVISPAKFQTRTGNWYFDGNTTKVINVQMPSIGVKLYTVGGTDVTNGRIVKADTELSFRLDSNLYEALSGRTLVTGDNTNIKVVVMDEEGTTYTGLYENKALSATTSLTNLTPTNSQFYLSNESVSTGRVTNWAVDSGAYKAGTYTFYAQVSLNGLKDNLGTITGVTKSAVGTIEIVKDDVMIEANKDTVIRNNDFAVTITGRPATNYVLWVKGSSTITGSDTAPYIKANQNGVTVENATLAGAYKQFGKAVSLDVCKNDPEAGGYYAMVKLSDSGSRTVGFGTNETTKDQTYTLRTDLYQTAETPTYDTVKVKVEKGDVTLTASGDSSYYIGEEIVFSGTNTDSASTYLFITGPNLAANGAPFDDSSWAVTNAGTMIDPNDNDALKGDWAPRTVETDDTWEFKWGTGKVNLDAGTYTVYAVTTPKTKASLGDATYATTSVVIKKPFITATTSSATVAKGDDLYITGNAEGDPTEGVQIWVLGKNYVLVKTDTVEDNGAFSYKFTSSNLASGQYFVVIQHPMYNDELDITKVGQNVVRPNLDSGINTTDNELPPVFIIEGIGSLQGSDAATALVNAMDSPDIDDTYYKLTFMVEEPWIIIDAVGDKYVGETFTITGTTNLAVGDSLIVEATSSSFTPTEKTQSGAFSGASGTVLVTAGDKDGVNNWEFAIDASSFTPDEYIVTVEGVGAGQTATQTFNVLKAEPTAEPTETPVTTPVETAATPVATPVETPEEAAPGFGVLLALVGLGAVAALIVRKD